MKNKALVILLLLSILQVWSSENKVQGEQPQRHLYETFANMPDSVCPYLDFNMRNHLARYAFAGIMDTIENNLNGRTVCTAYNIEENSMSVQMTPNLKWELKLRHDTIYLTSELCAPRCAVTEYKYDADWHLITKHHNPFTTEDENEREMILYNGLSVSDK